MTQKYEDLEVWQQAMNLVTMIYELTKEFPKDEMYGLTSQIRRAAVSIPSNIAEGQGRATTKDFLHFLVIARGSLNEVKTQLEIANRLGYTNNQPPTTSHHQPTATNQTNTVGRLLNGLIRSLRSRMESN